MHENSARKRTSVVLANNLEDRFCKRAKADSTPAAKVSIGTVNEARCKFTINRGYVPRDERGLTTCDLSLVIDVV